MAEVVDAEDPHEKEDGAMALREEEVTEVTEVAVEEVEDFLEEDAVAVHLERGSDLREAQERR